MISIYSIYFYIPGVPQRDPVSPLCFSTHLLARLPFLVQCALCLSSGVPSPDFYFLQWQAENSLPIFQDCSLFFPRK